MRVGSREGVAKADTNATNRGDGDGDSEEEERRDKTRAPTSHVSVCFVSGIVVPLCFPCRPFFCSRVLLTSEDLLRANNVPKCHALRSNDTRTHAKRERQRYYHYTCPPCFSLAVRER